MGADRGRFTWGGPVSNRQRGRVTCEEPDHMNPNINDPNDDQPSDEAEERERRSGEQYEPVARALYGGERLAALVDGFLDGWNPAEIIDDDKQPAALTVETMLRRNLRFRRGNRLPIGMPERDPKQHYYYPYPGEQPIRDPRQYSPGEPPEPIRWPADPAQQMWILQRVLEARWLERLRPYAELMIQADLYGDRRLDYAEVLRGGGWIIEQAGTTGKPVGRPRTKATDPETYLKFMADTRHVHAVEGATAGFRRGPRTAEERVRVERFAPVFADGVDNHNLSAITFASLLGANGVSEDTATRLLKQGRANCGVNAPSIEGSNVQAVATDERLDAAIGRLEAFMDELPEIVESLRSRFPGNEKVEAEVNRFLASFDEGGDA